MKKILFIAVGLMSLLGMLSCDDSSTFIETEEFYPYGFFVKDATTIQIVGYKFLVIEETEKTDWNLYVQYHLPFIGSEPLQIRENEINLMEFCDKNSVQVDIETNMENEDFSQDLSFAVSGLQHSYTYMGEQRQLMCLSLLKVKVNIIVDETSNEPMFHEKGHIEYTLTANDSICLVQKSVPFETGPLEYYNQQGNK